MHPQLQPSLRRDSRGFALGGIMLLTIATSLFGCLMYGGEKKQCHAVQTVVAILVYEATDSMIDTLAGR